MAAEYQRRTSRPRSKAADDAFRQNDNVRVSHDGTLSISTEAIFASPNVQRDLALIAKLRANREKSPD